jgi:dienelactone hydrolase
MVFISRTETLFAVTLIVDLVSKNGYLDSSYCTFLLLPFTILTFYGLIKGEVRLHIPLCYIVHLLNFLLDYYFGGSYAMSWVTAIIEGIVAILLVNLGSFSYYSASGPYPVGFRRGVLKGESCSPISVFYPCKPSQQRPEESKIPSFCLDGMENVKGFAKGLDNQKSWFYRDMLHYKILVEEGAELNQDFKDGGKKLTPVVVSHGLVGDRSSHVSLVKELVSYGCVVYTLNHTDKSATYFKNTKENPPKAVYYEHFQPSVHKVRMDQHRLTQLKQRTTDISCLIDLIKEEAKTEFQSLDLDKLVVVGHCLGGMTSIEMAHKFKEVKLCCALNPYFSARAPTIEESDDYTITQPLLMLTTQLYHDNPFLADYEAKKIHKKFFADS